MTLPTSGRRLKILEDAERNNWLVTGLIYVNPEQPSFMIIWI
jgi:hypothetical protein